jgi:hypothetical protein
MDLCAESMTLSEFMTITEEAYSGTVALVTPFILRTSMLHKHEILCDIFSSESVGRPRPPAGSLACVRHASRRREATMLVACCVIHLTTSCL